MTIRRSINFHMFLISSLKGWQQSAFPKYVLMDTLFPHDQSIDGENSRIPSQFAVEISSALVVAADCDSVWRKLTFWRKYVLGC